MEPAISSDRKSRTMLTRKGDCTRSIQQSVAITFRPYAVECNGELALIVSLTPKRNAPVDSILVK